MFQKRFSVAAVFVLLVLGVFLGTQIRAISSDNVYEQFKKFQDVLSYTQKFYVEEVPTSKLVEAAVIGLLKDLDPHSVYIPPKQLEKVQEDFKGSFEGIGIEFNIYRDTIRVVTPIFGGPSEKVGLQAGDKIVRIDGESSVKITNDQVQKKLRGEKGTTVKVDVVRPGVDQQLSFTITRDKIPLYSVDTHFMLEEGIGYMSVNRFAQNTYQEFMEGLRDLRSKGMKKLILDLRFNPGGYMEQSVRMANEFLEKGEKIVYTRGRRTEYDEDFDATGSGEFQDLPLIILLSNSSASASEIVAGAVQDHDRGLIVGETSFGKGLVQKQFDLSDGSAFRLTISRYYTPSGRLIQRPYDGKSDEEYYMEADREEESADDLEHHSADEDTTRPKFKTDGGRTVLGGGGISPDYTVKVDKLNKYTAMLRGKLYEYMQSYMDREGPALRKRYPKEEIDRFMGEFKVGDPLLKDLVAFAEEKGVKYVEAEYKEDETFIRVMVKSQIARQLFGNEGYFRAILEVDNQFQKARNLFPEAKKIAGLK